LGVLAQRDAVCRSEALDQPKARVVARALVFLAWIAQAYDETDQGLLLLFLLALVGGRGLLGGALALLAFLALLALGRRALAFLRRGCLLGGRHLRRRHGGGGGGGFLLLGDERRDHHGRDHGVLALVD